MNPDLSIIIPAFDEAERITPTLQRVCAWAERQPFSVELIVVDDGSTDNTAAIVESAAAADARIRLVEGGVNRGKGAAVGLGVDAAQGAQVLFTDADLSMPIEGYHALRSALDRGAHIAIASRSVPGATVGARPPLLRSIAGRVFNGLVRLTVLPGVRDTQCGFKLFRADVARDIFSRRHLDNFAFDVELLWLARKLGYRCAEVPTHWDHVGGSRIMPWSDSARMFRSILSIPSLHRDL